MIFGLLPQTNALEKPIFSKYIARLNITSVWSKKWANECLRCSIRGFKGPDGEGDRWRASAHAPLRLDRCHFPAPPCPQPAAVRTSKLPSRTKRGHTHTLWHTGPVGIWAGEKIPWKIPESWAFKSLEAGPCFKAKWAAFMLRMTRAWMASTLQVADKGRL